MKNFKKGMGSRLKKPRYLPDEIAGIIRDEIQKGTFKPGGEFPSEMQFTKEFGVSRSVIREALSRLKNDGLLETRQGKGASVIDKHMRHSFRVESLKDISKTKFIQLMELRIIVESETASLAALRRTDPHIQRLKTCLSLMDEAILNGTDGTTADLEFHKELAKITGNFYLIEFILFLNGRLKEIIKISREQAAIMQGMSEVVQKEHIAIFDAVADGDSAKARNAMIQHITNTSRGLGLDLDIPNHFEK